MPDEIAFTPVYADSGFLAGVYVKDPHSDHDHHWIFESEQRGICVACGLRIRIYSTKEALELIHAG